MQNIININKQTMALSGNMTINTFKIDIENNIIEIVRGICEDGYVDILIDNYHLYFIILDDGNLAFIYDADKVQKQVIIESNGVDITSLYKDSDMYDFIVNTSTKSIYKEILKDSEINEKKYKQVLNIDDQTSMQIKFRLMSLLISDIVTDLLSNEKETVDNIRRFEYISDNKIVVLLYDMIGNKLCADIQIGDEPRETFFLCYPEPIKSLDPNSLSSCILNGVIADYLSEDFGLVYAAQDSML